MCLRAKPPPLPPADQSEMEGKSRGMGWKVGGGEGGWMLLLLLLHSSQGSGGLPSRSSTYKLLLAWWPWEGK